VYILLTVGINKGTIFIYDCVEFSVSPGRSWMLETSRIYNIQIEIFDKESHKIYPSEVSCWFNCLLKCFVFERRCETLLYSMYLEC
jgi:hypothetical protein